MESKFKGRRSPRWAFMDGMQINKEGDPYLDRLRLFQCPWFGLFLHRIHRPDHDPHPHDHPWWFMGLVLSGGYEEEVWPDKTRPHNSVSRQRKRWSIGSLSRQSAHRICCTDQTLWTLVLTGPRVADWGFWVPREYIELKGPPPNSTYLVPWQDYEGILPYIRKGNQ